MERRVAWEYRKYKPTFCPSGAASYSASHPKFPHSFAVQAEIFAIGPAQIAPIFSHLAGNVID